MQAREAAEAQAREASVADCRANSAEAAAQALHRKGRLAEAAEMALAAEKWRLVAEVIGPMQARIV